MTRAVVPHMRQQGGGRIINIGSVLGVLPKDARTSRYSSSLESGSRKFASNCVFVYAGSMTETRMPLVRSSWSSDSE